MHKELETIEMSINRELLNRVWHNHEVKFMQLLKIK